MKIAVLVDLSTICKKAIEYGGYIAKKSDAEVVVVHVSDSSEPEKIEAEVSLLTSQLIGLENVSQHIVSGDFFTVIPSVIKDIKADMVVVATHGKVGLMQNLFGANILKLVNAIPVPSVVVQEISEIDANTFSKVLFPVGPHNNFEVKIKQTAKLAKVFNSTVVIYTVRNDVRGIPDKLRSNIDASVSYFESNNVKYETVNEEPAGFSVGYAKYILDYAKNNQVSAISVMAQLSNDNGYIGNSDKENILLNEQGLPVLCTNS